MGFEAAREGVDFKLGLASANLPLDVLARKSFQERSELPDDRGDALFRHDGSSRYGW